MVPIFEYGPLIYGGTTLNKLQKIERLQKKILRIVFRKKPSDSIFETLFEFKILTICELYIKHLLSFSLKSYFGLHSSKMRNEILTANQNFSYNTRSKTTRIIQTKTSKRIWTRTSLGYRGRILINFLLKQKILPQLEQETMSCIKPKELVNALQYSLIIQTDTLKNLSICKRPLLMKLWIYRFLIVDSAVSTTSACFIN